MTSGTAFAATKLKIAAVARTERPEKNIMSITIDE